MTGFKKRFQTGYTSGPRARAASECVVVQKFEPELRNTAKPVKVRDNGNCHGCKVVLVAGNAGFWQPSTKRLYCSQCVETNNR